MNYRAVDVAINGQRRSVTRGTVTVAALKKALGVEPGRRLQEDAASPQLFADDDVVDVRAGMAFSDHEWLRYVPSPKHKSKPSRGVKGSICPKDVDLATAQSLLDASVPDGRKRWSTDGERFFVAHSDGVGGWHGWPEPIERVPSKILRSWQASWRLS